MQDLALSENLQKETNIAVVEADSIQILDNQTNKKASDYLKVIKSFQKQIKEELRPGIDKAHSLHRHLVKQEKDILNPLLNAEQMIKNKISKFLIDQEKIRNEEQRRLQEKAESEERKRREELLRQAKGHEEAGRIEKAEERKQQAAETFVPSPIVESTAEKQEGISTRDNWKAEVYDEDSFIEAVIKGHLPANLVMPSTVQIGRYAKLIQKKSVANGLRIYNEPVVNVRT